MHGAWAPNTGSPRPCTEARFGLYLTSKGALRTYRPPAQVAELVDALVSGTSGASRGGSSPLLGTKLDVRLIPKFVSGAAARTYERPNRTPPPLPRETR